MSTRDAFCEHVEAVAALAHGIGVTCRLMHRDPFEDGRTGEIFPAYDEYEARANGKYVTFDRKIADLDRDTARPVIEMTLEHLLP